MQQIQSAEHAFAAIRSDGRVVTWGNGTLTEVRAEAAPKSQKKGLKFKVSSSYIHSSVFPDG